MKNRGSAVAIVVPCPSCGTNLKLRDGMVGRKIGCPKCMYRFVAEESEAGEVESQDEANEAAPPEDDSTVRSQPPPTRGDSNESDEEELESALPRRGSHSDDDWSAQPKQQWRASIPRLSQPLSIVIVALYSAYSAALGFLLYPASSGLAIYTQRSLQQVQQTIQLEESRGVRDPNLVPFRDPNFVPFRDPNYVQRLRLEESTLRSQVVSLGVAAVCGLVFALLHAANCYGLFSRQRWSYVLTLILYGLGTVVNVIALVAEPGTGTAFVAGIGIAFSLAVVVYFSQPSVRSLVLSRS